MKNCFNCANSPKDEKTWEKCAVCKTGNPPTMWEPKLDHFREATKKGE